MAIDVNADVIPKLEAAYLQALTDLQALPGIDFSDDGRCINFSQTRDSLTKYLEQLEKRLAQLGAPVGTQAVPFLTVTSCP